jgi:AraC-like DNA-binding protein
VEAVMDRLDNLPEFEKYSNNFGILESISYRYIYMNGLHVKPLGLHFLNYGTDWSVRKHSHTFFEAHYITDGRAYTTLGDKEYELNSGWFYIMPPGTFHSHRQLDNTSHIGFALRWEICEEVDNGSNNSILLDSMELAGALKNITAIPMEDDGSILEGMLNILKTAGRGSRILELQAAFLQLIIRLADACSSKGMKHETQINRIFLNSNVVASAVRFIEENYSQDIDVKDVAASVHVSYSHLSRLFKEYAGIAINRYINQVRILRAQYLLKCTKRDIDSIAFEVGFKSSIYFCGIFKKEVGVSPGFYRKNESRLLE